MSLRRVSARAEYLAKLGGYGALVAGAQTAALERAALAAFWQQASRDSVMLHFAWLEGGFVAALCSFYILTAWILEHGSSATTMNLSLLTSDFWSVLVGVGLLHSRPDITYAAAFALTIGGLLLYHGGSTPPTEGKATADRQRLSFGSSSSSLAEPLVQPQGRADHVQNRSC